MDESNVLSVMRESILVMLKIAAPFLIISIVAGLVVAIFQAATQIHEQTLTFVPKVLLIMLLLLILGSWIISLMGDFFNFLFDLMTRL